MTATRAMTWVVGGGGLLGKAVTTERHKRGRQTVVTSMVPWHDPDAAVARLADAAQALLGSSGGRCRIAWCAGAGVVGTSAEALGREVDVLSGFLEALRRADLEWLDAFFVASSAGGLYAGSPEPPFTEAHPVVPISPYGQAKAAAEEVVVRFAEETGVSTVIGRMANIYGAGQDLSKGQGLISQLCRAHLTAQPVSIYVSLDTVRDYLFVDDCAAMVVDALDRAASRGPLVGAPPTVKILASQQPTTVGALLGVCRRVFKRAPLVVLGASATARYQPHDLRLRSVVWPELDQRSLTSLAAGISATAAGMLRDVQSGALALRGRSVPVGPMPVRPR